MNYKNENIQENKVKHGDEYSSCGLNENSCESYIELDSSTISQVKDEDSCSNVYEDEHRSNIDDCCGDNKEDDCCEDDCEEEHVCSCESGILENIENEKEISKKPLIKIAIGIVIFAIGYSIANLNLISGFESEIISQIIYLSIVIFVGKDIITYGIKSIFKKEIKIEFLMTIATVGAFLLGDGAEGASLILLFSMAEYLEEFALDRSKRSLVKLIKLSPDKAIVKKENKEIEVNIEDIAIGDIVVVKPGDKIPVDGIIISGSSSVNQAMITGESLAVDKKEGDEVYTSTINEEGYLEIKVTKSSDDTIFSKIISLIKDSEDKKAKIDLFIDKFAKYYTPTVVGIAVFVAIIPPLIYSHSFLEFSQLFSEWFYRALVLLIISCPCALAISTPVSMVSAITAGTKNGIIIKGGEYVEELAKIKAILFDKTGTLTEGRLEISNIISKKGFSQEDIISVATSLEKKSKHPIAKAFKEYSLKNNIQLKDVENFQSIAGKGLKGDINSETYYLGKKELFKFNEELYDQINLEINNQKGKTQGKTQVILGNNSEILGFISLSDKIRENSLDTISELKNKGIKTFMITGDNSSTAGAVSKKIGLDSYYSDLLPEDKVKIVERISNECDDIAMVGDGVNDAPSLVRADVGIAMGMEGADVAVETADIVLMQDNISKVNFLIHIAKKTMGIIKQNISVSLVIKGSLAILGVIGYITLWEAIIIGDMGLTLAVVANSLRIR